MTVYVDSAMIPARVGRYNSRWSHLLTDDPTHEELHELAQRIGLRRAWDAAKHIASPNARKELTDAAQQLEREMRDADRARSGSVPFEMEER